MEKDYHTWRPKYKTKKVVKKKKRTPRKQWKTQQQLTDENAIRQMRRRGII